MKVCWASHSGKREAGKPLKMSQEPTHGRQALKTQIQHFKVRLWLSWGKKNNYLQLEGYSEREGTSSFSHENIKSQLIKKEAFSLFFLWVLREASEDLSMASPAPFPSSPHSSSSAGAFVLNQ